MTISYQAAVLHAPGQKLAIETVKVVQMKPADVLVRIKAAGLCHTDLEVIDGSLRTPMPILLGREAAGIVEQTGPEACGVEVGDHVVLSWNPHCGDCFYCGRDLPILCEDYPAGSQKALHFDRDGRARLADGRTLHQLMYLGTFSEYAVVSNQEAVAVPAAIRFEQACLLGCGIMTGAGAALNVRYGDAVMVIGCGAVGLAAVQGARLEGAGTIIAVDLDDGKLSLARRDGAAQCVNARQDDAVAAAHAATGGRGVDAVFEAAGSQAAFGMSIEAVRPGGEVIWLGKIDVAHSVSLRWRALMQEKRLRWVTTHPSCCLTIGGMDVRLDRARVGLVHHLP